MKVNPLPLIGLTVALVLVASQPLSAQRRPITQNSRTAIAQLEEVKGTVFLKRNGSPGYVPIKPPLRDQVTLFWGDLLKVDRNARAVVRCNANAVKWIVPNDGVPRGIATICS